MHTTFILIGTLCTYRVSDPDRALPELSSSSFDLATLETILPSECQRVGSVLIRVCVLIMMNTVFEGS